MTDVDDGAQGATPDAPWGINPRSGRPYKVDPEKMRRLRSLRPPGAGGGGGGPKPPRERAGTPAPPRPARTAAAYAVKLLRWMRLGAKALGRKNQIDGVILAVSIKPLSEAWGQVCVDYPRVGGLVDRVGKGGSLTEAVSLTVITAGMVLANHGLLAGTPLEGFMVGMVEDALVEAGVATREPTKESFTAATPAA